MKEEIIVTNHGNLRDLIKEAVKEQLLELLHWVETHRVDNDRLMSREQTLSYLGISSSTLYRWTKDGLIPAYSIGDRTYYKPLDLNQALIRTN